VSCLFENSSSSSAFVHLTRIKEKTEDVREKKNQEVSGRFETSSSSSSASVHLDDGSALVDHSVLKTIQINLVSLH
jgi:hypothetical protein